jgi:hypothetical protein
MVVSAVLAPAYLTLLRAPVDRLAAVLSRHKPAALAEQEALLKQAVAEGATKAGRCRLPVSKSELRARLV